MVSSNTPASIIGTSHNGLFGLPDGDRYAG